MSPDFTGLSHLAEPKAGAWAPPRADDLANGYGLFYDQSLTNTGWVELLVKDGIVRVVGAGTIKPKPAPGLTGFAADLSQGANLFDQLVRTPRWISGGGAAAGFDVVAAETPPIGFKVKGDGNSSKLAALAITIAYGTTGRQVVLIQSQAAKKTMTGRGAKVTKKESHDAMRLHCSWVEGMDHVTNEHTRDALLNGIHWFAKVAPR